MGPVLMLRRLLAALFVAGAFLVVGPAGGAVSAAAPCTCTGTTQDFVRAANAVFTGRVVAITPSAGTAGNASARTNTVQIARVYKGGMITTETVDVVTPRSFGNCARPLRQGRDYVFFVESDEGFTATDCGGTARTSAPLVRKVERLLGGGRPPVPVEPDPVEVTLTPVNTDDPASLTRLAAPGVALVIVGLLGLTVVRRLARPRP
jgi:hypothetical protein